MTICSAYNIAEVHQFPRNLVMEFQNICNEMVAPFFLRHPVHYSLVIKTDNDFNEENKIQNNFTAYNLCTWKFPVFLS